MKTSSDEKQQYQLQTLCWKCKRALAIKGVACSWTMAGVIPDGAEFIKMEVLQSYKGGTIKIIKCPQFLADDRERSKYKHAAQYKELVAAIVSQALKDYKDAPAGRKKEIERFLDTEYIWGTNLNGKAILRRLKEIQ